MSRLLTPADVEAVGFRYKTSLLSRRDWYDADEVDEFLDDVEYTIGVWWNTLGMGKDKADEGDDQ